MSVTTRIGDPRSAEGSALLTAAHALMRSMYAPEDCHALALDDLCVPEITLLIAERNGTAIGCAALKDCGAYGEVKSMYVDPTARGAGAGKALLAHLEKLARAAEHTALKLETGDDLTVAQGLYQRHGFRFCGPFGDYREGPRSLFMDKPLT